MALIHGLHFNNLRGDLYGGLVAAVVALPLALAFGVASGAGAVAAPVYDIRDIFQDEQYAARNDIVEMEDPELGTVRMVGVIPKFPETPGEVRWTGKDLGSFNREIYCDLLGLSTEELESLKTEGIV